MILEMSEDEKNLLLTMVKSIEERSQRIERALFGEKDISKGVLEKVAEHDDQLKKMETLKWKFIGAITIATPIAIMLWEKIKHLLGLG